MSGFVALLVLGACGSGSETGPAIIKTSPPAPIVTSISVSPGAPTIELGAAIPLTAVVRDQFGAVLSGQAVAWASTVSTVASVDATGIVTGRALGAAGITASVGDKAGIATVVVVAVPVAAVNIDAVPGSLTAGQTIQLVAILKDRNGVIAVDRAVTWTSSTAYVARVGSTGIVTAVGGGTTTISATSEGVSATTSVVVAGPPAPLPVVSGIAPASMLAGSTATITGTGFDPIASNNGVTVRGAPATLLSASATQIIFTVPCVGSGLVDVRVMANTRAGPAFVQAVTVVQRSLTVGQALVLSDPACNELAPSVGNARYVVSVFNTASSENALTDFELGGNVASAVLGAKVPMQAVAAAKIATGPPGPEASRDRAHWEMLERNRANYQEGQAILARQPFLNRANQLSVARPPDVGDMRSFFFTYSTTCNDSTRVMRGKVLYAGTKAIIWEDSANTLRAANDSTLNDYYHRLGVIFDQDQYDVVRTNFGDPLRRDAVTDNDGHVNMVFSERLNATGAAAYVTSCDQFPRTVFRGSNFGQNFYGSVPTTKASNLNSTLSPDGWFNFMARTVVHEVKHIAALSARVANGSPNFEESWLEEGTARHAEELWVRQYLEHVSWKGNTGFGTAGSNGIFCDFHPENDVCNAADVLRRPGYGMRRHFNEILNKLQQPWNWSLYNDGSGQSGSVFYQTAWSLVRYAIDRYGTSEAAFLTAFTNATTTGLANLSAVSGVAADQLVGGWSLALYAD
ncbi:MAG: Ig-like domain-containing protein, partial [bacterium]